MKKWKSMNLFLIFVLSIFLALAGCSGFGSWGSDSDSDDDSTDVPATNAPTVNAVYPVNLASGVPVNSVVTAAFSESMDVATILTSTFSLAAGADPVPGAVTYNADTKTATLTPTSNMAAGTLHTVTLTTGIKNPAGTALASNVVWTFTPGVSTDVVAPMVVSTFPADSATGVAVNTGLSATFSEGMDPSTIATAHFTLTEGANLITGTVTYDAQNKKANFFPSNNLAGNKTYSAKITTGVKDLAGNALAVDKVWSFSTVTVIGAGPAPVRLGTAGNYAILAKTAITTVPASVITGDIGLSPAAESYMTGFSQTKGTGYSTSPQVTGFMYAADMTPPTPSNMTTAISDMEAAYTDAATRPAPAAANTDIGGGTIGGLTFAPGLYRWGSTVNVTTDITIAGSADDVWIFQITKDLTVSSAVKVILSGGAQAKNIFWQVAEVASMGTTSHFEGVILSQTQVIMKTGSSLNGRALAQTQVTLDTSTVTEPAQ
jgi:hypothetical protein